MINIEILNLAYSRSCYDRHEPDLIELNDFDFEDLLENIKPLLINKIKVKRYEAPKFRVDSNIAVLTNKPKLEQTDEFTEAIEHNKLVFRGCIVIPNPLIGRGYIKAFNKSRFATKLFDVIKDREHRLPNAEVLI